MKIAAIIPSRYGSTRFMGKPLVMIDGKTMIERVYRQAEKCRDFCDVIVATDDKRIADVVVNFGGHVEMTSPHHNSGSERLWEVVENSNFDAAVNVQGDEPIISEKLLSQLCRQLVTGQCPVVTAYYVNSSYHDYLSPNVVKVVLDNSFKALYFSRSPIPYVEEKKFTGFFQHIGLYGYLRGALEKFVALPAAELERIERLEQLRFLENNLSIKAIQSQYPSVGVDVPEDVQRIENMLKQQ